MAGTHGYVQLPPDGAGKQVPQSVLQEINYNSGTIAFAIGDIVTFGTSTWVGTVIKVEGTVSTGEIHVRIEEPVPNPVPVMTLSEDILVNAVKFAEVANLNGGTYYLQQAVIAGNNMTNIMEVDKLGAAHMRFGEGSPQFDAFGKLQISDATTLGEYLNQYQREVKDLWHEETTGGTVTHIPANSGLLYTTTTTSGSKAASTSHLYHKYQLGTSQLHETTIATGDTGKTNVTRIWGYGDATDGLFFRLQDTILQAYMRSSTVGDHTVAQSAWSHDRLNGEGGEFNPSGHTLDVTMDNIYWIDFQWLGAGRVRFGVIIEGIRITCHEMYHGNKYTQPYIRTGTLPVHVGQVNTGTAGSSSEMRVWCQVVKSEGKFQPQARQFYHHIRKREQQNGGIYMAAVMNWHPGRMMFAIRPKLTINGITNRAISMPVRLSLTNTGTESMWIQARRGASFVGTPSWIDFHSESSMEYAENGDCNIDQDNRGVQVGMWSIPPQSTENIDLTDVFGYRKEKLLLGADGTDQTSFGYIFTCWNMSPIAGGSDVGTYTVNIAAASNTITKTAGTSFVTANYDGVAFADGMMIYIRNSDSDDGYYLIDGAPSATVITVKNLDGSAVSFTGSTADVITLQGGTRTLYFGNLNVEEIW